MKLNQVIAIAQGEKARKQKVFSQIYQTLQKEVLFDGISKRYEPIEEDPTGANKLPPEDKGIQITVGAAIKEAYQVLEETFNIVATQDVSNCSAKADIKTDDKVIAMNVPVTYLLFIEKQLVDIKTFINALPVLDPAEKWTFSEASGYFQSEPKQTIRTKKVLKNHIKAVATDKHPAQVDVYTEDVPVGTWTTIKYSGCISKTEKNKLQNRILELEKAVKMAREEANGSEVQRSKIGSDILEYIFE